MAAVFVYIMMNTILLLYSCCDRTVMKGNFRKHYQYHYVKCSVLNITRTVEGRVTTTLPEVATVCNGSQLELNCTITGSFLEWRIIPEQNHSQLSALMYSPRENESFPYGDSTVTFTIISHPMEQTSYYRIVISPIINSFNGAEVKCTDLEHQESTSTVINVANEQGKVVYNMVRPVQSTSVVVAMAIIMITILTDFDSIMVRSISERSNRDDVEVFLEWVPDNSLYTYHVNITPQPAFSMRLKRNSIRLKVEYNVLYNMSIVTVSPCGQAVTINEILYYGEYRIHVHGFNNYNED